MASPLLLPLYEMKTTIKDVLRILPHTKYDLIARETAVQGGPVIRMRLRKKKHNLKIRKEIHHV